MWDAPWSSHSLGNMNFGSVYAQKQDGEGRKGSESVLLSGEAVTVINGSSKTGRVRGKRRKGNEKTKLCGPCFVQKEDSDKALIRGAVSAPRSRRARLQPGPFPLKFRRREAERGRDGA